MGYRLAAKVRKDWAELNAGPYRLLDQIAQALPEGSRKCWFGMDRYAQMIGKDATEAGRKSAQRYLAALIRVGALRLVQKAHRGRTTIYELVFPSEMGRHLSTPGTPTKADGMVDTKVDGMVDTKVDGMVDTKVDGMVDTPEAERWTLSDRNGGQKVSTQGRREEEPQSPSVVDTPSVGGPVQENLTEVPNSPARDDEKVHDHEKQDDEHDGGEQRMGMPQWFRDKLDQDKKLLEREEQQRKERERQEAQRLKDMLTGDAADSGTDFDRGWEDGWGRPAPTDPDQEPEPPEEPGSHDGWGQPAGGL